MSSSSVQVDNKIKTVRHGVSSSSVQVDNKIQTVRLLLPSPLPLQGGRGGGFQRSRVPLTSNIHSIKNTFSLLSELCSDDVEFLHDAFDFSEAEAPPWSPLLRRAVPRSRCCAVPSSARVVGGEVEVSPRSPTLPRSVPCLRRRVVPPPALAEGDLVGSVAGLSSGDNPSVGGEVEVSPRSPTLLHSVPCSRCRVILPPALAEGDLVGSVAGLSSSGNPSLGASCRGVPEFEKSRLRPGAPSFRPSSYGVDDVPAVHDVYRRRPPVPLPTSFAGVSAVCDYPLMPSMARRFKALCDEFASASPSVPVSALLEKVPPGISPWRFAELIQMSIDSMHAVHPLESVITPDFKAVELFEYLKGSQAIESDGARYVFAQLFVGGGRFPTMFEGDRSGSVLAKNPRKLVVPASADPYPSVVPAHPQSDRRRHLDLATSEVSAGRCLGPFTESEATAWFRSFVTSSSFIISRPLAVSTKDRLVHNLTDPAFPINLMLNDDQLFPIKLDHTTRFIDALRDLAVVGSPLHMVTADISKGYRRLFTRVQDVQHLGLRVDVDFNGHVPFFDGASVGEKSVKKGDVLYVFDRSLPFGLKTSVTSFCTLTALIRDVVQEKLGSSCRCLAYVDDFVVAGPPPAVRVGIDLLRSVLDICGLPENPLKLQVPAAMGTFLGVDYDLTDPRALRATLPKDKIVRYVKHLHHYINKSALSSSPGTLLVTRTELQSLVGKLAHAAYIFRSGRPFYQRLLERLRGRSQRRRIHLDSGCLDDMRWWVHLLENHSGSLLVNPDQRIVRVFTDASTSTGYGVYLNGQYFSGTWSSEVKDLLVDFSLTINELELVALNFALETFGDELRGSCLHFRCDNVACVSNIHSMSSQQPVRAALLRRLFSVAAHYGIELQSSYINTKLNLYADTLSRGDLTSFFSLPHCFPLSQVHMPALSAMALLTDPTGPENPSSPAWFKA